MRNSSSRRTSDSHSGVKVAAGIAILGIALVATGVQSFLPSSPETSCTVTGKDRTSGKGGGMRIYTEECGTLSVGDRWLALQFNASDRYGTIEEGKAYQFETVGMRIPIFSTFPNIVSVEPVG